MLSSGLRARGSFRSPTPRVHPVHGVDALLHATSAQDRVRFAIFANRSSRAPTTTRTAASRRGKPRPDARPPPGTQTVLHGGGRSAELCWSDGAPDHQMM